MHSKILGLDIGERRIGVAISDSLGFLAHPLTTIFWKGIDQLISEINVILSKEDISKLVVGMPITMKGSFSAKTEEVKKIIDEIRSRITIDVIEVDERLTTKMAEQAMQAVGKKPSKNRNKIDQIAAVYILQSYLDRTKSNAQGA